MREFSFVDLCAGAGGMSLGLEQAGFNHLASVEIDSDACATLRLNRPTWNVLHSDIATVEIEGTVDLLAAGVPCPPFSVAGLQRGRADERDLFPCVSRLIEVARPRAFMLENVKGLAGPKFSDYVASLIKNFTCADYDIHANILNACGFGVPQSRERFFIVGVERGCTFTWPTPTRTPESVGAVLGDLMASNGWNGAAAWVKRANRIAPTVVGGSKKHGGADLGPSGSRNAWLSLGVDGSSIADEPPNQFCADTHLPGLTNRMVARIQDFPDTWAFCGGKTSQYRQIGNALPPALACAIGKQILGTLNA